MKRDISHYEAVYTTNYGFEQVMVRYRRKMLLDRLQLLHPKCIVEVGCGAELLYGHYLKKGGAPQKWVIVEPAKHFYELATRHNLPNCRIIEGFFEESVGEVKANLPRPPDLVICSGLLHEVHSAGQLLTSISQVMEENTLLHINVPNADSFHRRLAVAMGIIQNTETMSDRNRQLLQNKVYNIETLKADLTLAGLHITKIGGYFVKPFTHEQMEFIEPILDSTLLDGLYELGRQHPEWASEIYAESRRSKM